MIDRLLIEDLDFIFLIMEGFKNGVLISASTIIISQAINYGIKLLSKS